VSLGATATTCWSCRTHSPAPSASSSKGQTTDRAVQGHAPHQDRHRLARRPALVGRVPAPFWCRSPTWQTSMAPASNSGRNACCPMSRSPVATGVTGKIRARVTVGGWLREPPRPPSTRASRADRPAEPPAWGSRSRPSGGGGPGAGPLPGGRVDGVRGGGRRL